MTRAPPSASRWTISAVRVRGQGHRPTSSRLGSSMATMLTFAGGGQGPAEAGVPVQNAQLDLLDESGRGEEAEEPQR